VKDLILILTNLFAPKSYTEPHRVRHREEKSLKNGASGSGKAEIKTKKAVTVLLFFVFLHKI